MKLYSGIIELKPNWYIRLPYPMTWMEMARYRFDPLTMAIAGGIGLAAAGEIQAGRVAGAEAESQQAMANYNAAVQEREAQAIEQKTGLEQRRQAQEAARAMSRMQARIGVSGAVPTVGAPLRLQAKQASEFEMENLMIGYRGATEAARARSAAEITRIQAGVYGRRAKTAKQASYMRAGTTLLKGFGGMDWGKKEG